MASINKQVAKVLLDNGSKKRSEMMGKSSIFIIFLERKLTLDTIQLEAAKGYMKKFSSRVDKYWADCKRTGQILY